MIKKTDKWILSHLKSCDNRSNERAYTEVYRQYYARIEYFIVQNNGSQEDAADVFQDAILVLLDKIKTKKDEMRSSIFTFLYSVSRNIWFNRLKRKQTFDNIIKENKFEEVEEVSFEILEDEEYSTLFYKLMDSAAEDCKTIFKYYYFDNLKMNKISELMGFANAQIAKNKKYKCLNKLRKVINTHPELKALHYNNMDL